MVGYLSVDSAGIAVALCRLTTNLRLFSRAILTSASLGLRNLCTCHVHYLHHVGLSSWCLSSLCRHTVSPSASIAVTPLSPLSPLAPVSSVSSVSATTTSSLYDLCYCHVHQSLGHCRPTTSPVGPCRLPDEPSSSPPLPLELPRAAMANLQSQGPWRCPRSCGIQQGRRGR